MFGKTAMAFNYNAEHKAKEELHIENLPSDINILIRGQDEKLMLDSDENRIMVSFLDKARERST